MVCEGQVRKEKNHTNDNEWRRTEQHENIGETAKESILIILIKSPRWMEPNKEWPREEDTKKQTVRDKNW